MLGCSLLAQASVWWDDFPGMIQTADTKYAAAAQATVCLSGGTDDPCWGLHAQHLRLAESAGSLANLHRAGLKSLSWFEGFGTCEAYVAQLRRAPDGTWILRQQAPPLVKVFTQHWSWQTYDGTGEIRWVGLPNYFDNDDWAQPWTRFHPRYGSPPMTYPDGRLAAGYAGATTDPRHSRVLDASCSKDVLGHLTFEYEYNPEVNRLDHDTLRPHGPLAGLVKADAPPAGPPDPGFTPEEWKKLKRAGYAGVVSAGKDSACPIWIDYARASVRSALDAGTDGLWVDNFSPWDSFGGAPVSKAFGEWSVAGFRAYLAAHFPASARLRMGITNLSAFDIRSYLQNRLREWGGQPDNLSDPRWRDARWQNDALWRAYLIYKRQTGTAALERYYRTIKQEATAAGRPDFLVMGNDIPLFSLGWARGELDMVSTELSWGWHLTSGPRGLMPPPSGSYAPVYKLAREHAKGRFVNAWLYGPEAQLGRPHIARVLYYQALANHALPMPNPGGRTVGNPETDRAFFEFLRRAAPIFGNRRPLEEVGLYHSSSSQLLEMLPGGFRDHNHQPHSFAFWGWGTALSQLHILWRAVPEWKLNPEVLGALRLLIIPASEVFEARDTAMLETWVRQGGQLIITGNSGARLGEQGNFDLSPCPSTLAGLVMASTNGQAAAIGNGRVLYLRDDPGIPFYEANLERPTLLPAIGRILDGMRSTNNSLSLVAPEVPATVGLTLYRDGRRLFIDINNTDVDLIHDTVKPTVPLTFTISLPKEWRGNKLTLQSIGPEEPVAAQLSAINGSHVNITTAPVPVYTSLLIEAHSGN